MTATILDGKAAAAAVKEELRHRVDALRSRGIAPGLGTVLVGDDPGSHAYVGGKHKDCAEVGIESIRVDLPADTTQAQLEDEIRRLNADPAVTGYIVQLPLPRHLDANRVLELMDPAKDADGLHPMNLGLGYCNITKCCTEVCPEHIHITDNALIPLKERVVDRKYDPITWLGSKIGMRKGS